MKQKGFILISMLFMLVLIAVTAIALNRRSGLQARMAANQIKSIQISLGQDATVEKSIWDLTKDPVWRTASGGEDYTYAGSTYTRKVLTSALSGYTDAVTLTVNAKGSTVAGKTSLRYYLEDPLYVSAPNQIFIDAWDNIFIADDTNHSIFRVDGVTGAMTRVAGTGSSGYDASEDGGPATSARLDDPVGVWVDSTGVIYIADRDNHRIRKVDLAGNINTFAGTGADGYNGDGIQATTAKLKKPAAVFGDNAGNIYIADRDNHIIRKVDSAGIITTIAGTPGSAGYSGNGGPATSAKLNDPSGLFVTGTGAIYVADRDNCWIRKFSEGGDITRVAGLDWFGPSCGDWGDGGSATWAELDYPRGVYVDESSGYIYIGDSGNHRVRRFTEGGNLTTFAGTGTAGYDPLEDGGPATSAKLDTPRGVFMKSGGELVIADTMNSCLREVDGGNVIDSITSAGDPGFNRPERITLYTDGKVYIADKDNNRIRTLDTANQVLTVAGTGSAGYSGDGGAAVSAQLDHPRGIDLDNWGNFYIADTGNHCVRKVNTSGTIANLAGKCADAGDAGGTGGPALNAKYQDLEDLAVFSLGGGPQVRIYIADTGNHCIRKVDRFGNDYVFAGTKGSFGYAGDGGPAASAKLNKPRGVTLDASENVYIADSDNHCIRKVSAGNISTVAGIGGSNGYAGDGGAATSAKLNKPVDVFVDANGNLFIADQDNHVIRVVSVHDNKIYTLAGIGGSSGYNGGDQPAVAAKLNKPAGVTMASTRGGLKIFISDRDNNRIRHLEFRLEKGLY